MSRRSRVPLLATLPGNMAEEEYAPARKGLPLYGMRTAAIDASAPLPYGTKLPIGALEL